MSTEEKQTERGMAWRLIQACGGRMAVSRKLGAHFNTVQYWIDSDKIPAHHVPPLCEEAHNLFKPHQIRPDVFLPDSAEA